MAASDLSKTFEEFESDDISLETSVPTDLTMSPEHSDGEGLRKKRTITKQLIERKQLLHDLQVLKIEVSQKNLTIENIKAESLSRIEELEETLNDALHQKQILNARLESQLQIQETEAKKRQNLIKQELEDVRRRQQLLEAANEQLKEKAGDVWRTLKDLSLSEEKYYQLKTIGEDEISLRDYVAMRLFEAVKPLQNEIDQLKLRNKTLDEETELTSRELLDLQKELSEERQGHGEVRVKYQKLCMECADLKGKVKHDDYRVENYDRMKGERDNLEHDTLDVQRQLTVLEASHSNLQKERDDLCRELANSKQSVTLLRQDKDYLSRQVADLSNRSSFGEEKLQQMTRHLDDAKRAREEVYEKYVASRDQYKSEYEAKLRDELEQIRVRTNSEIDRLRTSTKEMYERENRNLREARDMAVSEREKCQAAEREMNTKYEQLLNEFRKIQMTGDNRVSSLQNDVKLRTFEAERTLMVHEETVKTLHQSELEIEKLHKKVEVLVKEYHCLEMGMEKRVSQLESSVEDKTVKLESYQRLEQEMDDVVMQAAEVEDEQDAEKVLFSYGYGANVPITSKRRLQQSVHLARRTLQLEKANTSLRHEIEREKQKTMELAEQVKSTNSLLDQTHQPYNYLIDSIRVRDEKLQQQRDQLRRMEEDLRKTEQERGSLIRTKNQMSQDLERLLNQKEEMAVMKQVMMNISRHGHRGKSPTREPVKPKSMDFNSFDMLDEPNIERPGSISLVKPRSPKWASKLKKQNAGRGNSKFSKVYGIAST